MYVGWWGGPDGGGLLMVRSELLGQGTATIGSGARQVLFSVPTDRTFILKTFFVHFDAPTLAQAALLGWAPSSSSFTRMIRENIGAGGTIERDAVFMVFREGERFEYWNIGAASAEIYWYCSGASLVGDPS